MIGDIRDGVVTFVIVALLAGPVALLWIAIQPRAVLATSRRSAGVLGGPELFIRGDGRFFVLGLVVGALCGVVAWIAARGRGPGVPIGLAAGGVFASFAVMHIGEHRAKAHFATEIARIVKLSPGETIHFNAAPLSASMFFVWAFASLAVFALLIAVRPAPS